MRVRAGDLGVVSVKFLTGAEDQFETLKSSFSSSKQQLRRHEEKLEANQGRRGEPLLRQLIQ
jgi:hypothetical protein